MVEYDTVYDTVNEYYWDLACTIYEMSTDMDSLDCTYKDVGKDIEILAEELQEMAGQNSEVLKALERIIACYPRNCNTV